MAKLGFAHWLRFFRPVAAAPFARLAEGPDGRQRDRGCQTPRCDLSGRL